MNWKNHKIVCVIVLMALSGVAATADDTRELSWNDLIPESEKLNPPMPPGGMYPPGFDDDPLDEGYGGSSYQYGVVEELNGKQVKIPGFIVPLEVAEGGKVSEFLLVPYFGACIHYPPPPPNQIVFVTMKDPVTVESPWDPVWVYGEMTTKFKQSDMGAAGYTLAANELEEYEY